MDIEFVASIAVITPDAAASRRLYICSEPVSPRLVAFISRRRGGPGVGEPVNGGAGFDDLSGEGQPVDRRGAEPRIGASYLRRGATQRCHSQAGFVQKIPPEPAAQMSAPMLPFRSAGR